MKQKVYGRASLTVEASLVCPLYFFAVMALVSLLLVLRYTNLVEDAMNQTLEKLSAYGYLYDQVENKDVAGIVSPAVIRLEFDRHNRGKELERWFHVNHGLGVSFLGSQVFREEKEIELHADYTMHVPIPIVSLIPIHVRQQLCGRAFVGESYLDEETNGNYVYITTKGSVYHEDRDCTYIHIQPKAVSESDIDELRNRGGRRYTLCRTCGETISEGMTVYVTDYGTKYHTDNACTQISREVKRIPRSDIGERRGCSKCCTDDVTEES